jgi:4-hydroxy-tetrahydrodipicolinate reductase
MGVRIAQAVMASPRAELAGAFEAPEHPAVGRPVAEVCALPGAVGEVAGSAAAGLAEAQVLIDFTAPAASLASLEAAAAEKKAVVIGTTGLDEDQKKRLADQARRTAVVWAPNMSVGMNLMFKLAGLMAKVLGPDYALELSEAHHDQKKDAPSGTALKLVEELAAARGWDPEEAAVYGRRGMVGARPEKEIGVSVIRGGGVVGDHTVFYLGQGERLELTHRAHSRDTFAQGAVRAALWAAQQKPGLYDMQDVLGLKE